MMYELLLIDTATRTVVDHLFLRAEDRAEALTRRPASWPITRTRAARLRTRRPRRQTDDRPNPTKPAARLH